jgi:hypothetical protein
MPNGRAWTHAENLCVAYSVCVGESEAQTIRRFQAAFPGTDRTNLTLKSRRSHGAVKALMRRIADAGMAAIAPTANSDPLEDSGPTKRLKSSWDPETQELVVLKPRDGSWSKPADLLDRAEIAYSLDDHGHPIPHLYTVPSVDLNEWATAMKLPDGTAASVPNWQCKLRMKPRVDAPWIAAFDRVLDQISEKVPEVPRVEYPAHDEPHLLELVLPDLHFGKLAHREESGEDMDTGIISDRMMACAESLIARAVEQYPIGEFVFVVGNDLLNADNEMGTTTGGTRQDVDSRKHKVLDRVMIAMTHVIDRLREIAPGHVYCVPGNHDRESSQAVARFLAAWYRSNGDVQIDVSPKTRKYHGFGEVLLGFAHGDQEPIKSLPLIMADEAPGWSRSRIREWHLGHLHSSKEMDFLTTSESRGVRVRHLPSLSGADAWHSGKGYHAIKQADAFVWSGSRGLRSIIIDQPIL